MSLPSKPLDIKYIDYFKKITISEKIGRTLKDFNEKHGYPDRKIAVLMNVYFCDVQRIREPHMIPDIDLMSATNDSRMSQGWQDEKKIIANYRERVESLTPLYRYLCNLEDTKDYKEADQILFFLTNFTQLSLQEIGDILDEVIENPRSDNTVKDLANVLEERYGYNPLFCALLDWVLDHFKEEEDDLILNTNLNLLNEIDKTTYDTSSFIESFTKTLESKKAKILESEKEKKQKSKIKYQI